MSGATPGLVIACWIAAATVVVAVAMLLAILLLRSHALKRERRDAHARAIWVAVIEHELDGGGQPLPVLPAGEVAGFIDAWNAVHEPLPEAHSRQLIALGHRINLLQACRPYLAGGYHDRATALVALGYLRDGSTFDELSPFLTDRSPIVSLCAARALSQIDPPRAMALFVPLIIKRTDWVPGNVAQILGENSDGSAARALSSAMMHANADTAVRLVRFLVDIDPGQAAGVIRRLLGARVDDHIVSVCLQVVNDPQDRDRVRALLPAARWHVRMQAATALGRIGDSDDCPHLEPLLADSVWWVRYRAAQAIAALPGVGVQGLDALRDRQRDRYGRDIIDQVLAERSLGAIA